MEFSERQANYSCDVIYVTNNELGFDYLRDNMAFTLDEIVQRPFFYCVVDEVDAILIDEARTPLIISGPIKHQLKSISVQRNWLIHCEKIYIILWMKKIKMQRY